MTDVLKDLLRLSWRGIEVPVLHCTARFQQDEVAHRYTYRDKELIESTGLQNWTFVYTIPFREDVAKGPYKHLFYETLPKFITACRDRTTGPLVDPILGPMPAKFTGWSHEIDVARRDGVDVGADFKYAPDEDTDEPQQNCVSNCVGEAGQLDEQIMTKKWAQAAGLEPMIDPFLLAESFAKMAQFKMGQVAAALDNATSKIDKTIAALDQLQDPNQWPVRQSVLRLKNATVQLALKVMSPGRTINQSTVGAPTTIAALASQYGMSVMAFLALNPMLAVNPAVPAGVTDYFYG